MACDLTIGGKQYSREYNDYAGCGGPEVEKAFREAFLVAAKQAADWSFPDLDMIKGAWEERARVKRRVEKWVSARDYFGNLNSDASNAIFRIYECGHEVEAARARGRVHAFAFVMKAWQHFVALSFANDRIQWEFIRPWSSLVCTWAALPIEVVERPPRPDEVFTLDQWHLLLAKQSGEKRAFSSLFALESYLNNYYGYVLDAWPCYNTNHGQLGYMFLCYAPSTVIRLAVCDNEQWVLCSPSKP